MQVIAEETRVAAAPRQVRAARDERSLADWVLLAAVGCFVALALPFFLGQVYVADDLGEFHLPLRAYYSQQLAAGQTFDWMPSLYGGFYVTAEGQLGAYHPLHLLLYRWLPLGAAFDLELLISYPLLFGGTYFFLKRWLARRDAALFGALVFAFGGFSLLHFVHPNAIAIVAHLPWLLLAIEVSLTEQACPHRATSLMAIALLTASQLLLGYPQYVWFSLLAETAYAVWRAIALRVSIARVCLVAWMLFVGFLAAGVQWLPTLDALSDSTRSATDSAFANTGSLHPLNLLQFVAPYLFPTRGVGQNTHELGLYIGAAPLLLCVWLMTQRQRWGRLTPLVWATLAFGTLALLLAFGEFGGLYRLQQVLPVVNHFRFPCRAIVLVQLALAIGAATAFAILCQGGSSRDPTGALRGVRALFVALAISVALAAFGPFTWPQYVASGILVWTGPLLIGVGVALVLLAARGRRGALIAIALFTAVDLSCYGLSYSVWGHASDLRAFAATVPLPSEETSPRVVAQEFDGLRTGNRMLLAGISRVDGYAGLEPRKRLDYSTDAARRRAGVNFVYTPSRRDAKTVSCWQLVAAPAPRARLVTHAAPWKVQHSYSEPTDDLGTVATDEHIDLPQDGRPGTVTVSSDLAGHLALECDAPSRQLLVTTESYHRGWVARVDGRITPVVRVDGDFLGCVVAPGKHSVDLTFLPRSLIVGHFISLGGLGLLLCTLALTARMGCQRPA